MSTTLLKRTAIYGWTVRTPSQQIAISTHYCPAHAAMIFGNSNVFNPAGYLLAAGGLDVAPEQCLVIGDRDDADGEAARRAHMRFQHVASRWPAGCR